MGLALALPLASGVPTGDSLAKPLFLSSHKQDHIKMQRREGNTPGAASGS